MKVLSTSVESSFTIKKSKFLCFGYFVKTKEEVKEIITQLKKEHPDASHVCYAYVLDDKTFYFTDGGEPSGSAGKPIYGALLSKKLNYALLVVIRYFGGIKFGPGPLRATFKDVSLKTLEEAFIKEAQMADIVQIKVPYSQQKQVVAKFPKSIYMREFDKDYAIF